MIYDIAAHVQNRYFDELALLSPPMRRAKLFEYIVEELPLWLKPGDRIAGWYGFEDADELDLTEPPKFPDAEPVMDEEWEQLRLALLGLNNKVAFTPAHTCLDYAGILQNGLDAYLVKLARARSSRPDDEMLAAMESMLNHVCRFADRFAARAREAAAQAEGNEKLRLEQIAQALIRVPRYSARSFLEAVQSVWILHALIPISELSWASISLGRLDQYLYPYYEAYLKEGGTEDEAKEILKNLFRLLDSYGDGACALNIGGMDEAGNDMINSLSRLLIEVEKEAALRAPIIAVRLTPITPTDVLDSLIDAKLFTIGQPTFYNEPMCRKAMLERCKEEADAIGFSVNSCMGFIAPGKEFSDMWGTRLNCNLALELAVTGGRPIGGASIPVFTKGDQPDRFEALLTRLEDYLHELITLSLDLHEKLTMDAAINHPNPLLSALTEGCVESGRDRAIGATYNTVTVETMGLINVCDALMAIKQLVYDSGRYTLKDFIHAVKADYAGCEQLRREILNCKKYGTGDEEVTCLMGRLCESIYGMLKSCSRGNRYYLPSLHTLDVNVSFGLKQWATMDGRHSGEPVNKNANPSHLLKRQEHTGIILSAGALEQYKFSGGQPIDLYFDRSWFATKELRDKLKQLILTYFELGGLQLQVNSVDVELLEKAYQHPERYPNVVVRKGGYSVRFQELTPEAQRSFIENFKAMERG
ncbi:MAG: DUF3029 family protein [Clostridiales bacterium]|nr:DUF3029 family protein [Clostridiales bacterium]